MAIPQAKALADRQPDNDRSEGPSSASLEASHSVVGAVEDGAVLPAVKVFNDFVAIMLTPRESCIALPGSSEYTNVGVVVGIGPQCVNEFTLGQNVVVNPKGGGIVVVEEQGPAYEDKVVQLFSEKNIFYTPKTGPTIKVEG